MPCDPSTDVFSLNLSYDIMDIRRSYRPLCHVRHLCQSSLVHEVHEVSYLTVYRFLPAANWRERSISRCIYTNIFTPSVPWVCCFKPLSLRRWCSDFEADCWYSWCFFWNEHIFMFYFFFIIHHQHLSTNSPINRAVVFCCVDNG